jgi:purine-binding chemotaxis protein CheW
VKQQMIIFKIGAEEFALNIMLAREVMVARDVTPVPETADYVAGITSLRGNLIAVLDLRKRLRAAGPGDTREERMIVADVDGRVMGLMVDGVSEIMRVTEGMVEPQPDFVREIGASYVQGIINGGGRFITMIDLRKALDEDIVCEMDRAIGMLKTEMCAKFDA